MLIYVFHFTLQVMGLEAHTTHVLQPLDKNPFSEFKRCFNKYLKQWNRRHGAEKLKPEDFFSVFNLAWHHGMTPENIRAGFKRAGIWPVSLDEFPLELFTVGDSRM